MSAWICKAGDYHRRILLTISGLDLTGATGVTFKMRPRDGGALVVNSAGVLNTGAGTASYQFTGVQLDTPGAFLLEAAVAFADGEETVPTEGFVDVVITPNLETA